VGPVTIDIKALAAELNRPVETLLALHRTNDPFYAGEAPHRRKAAEWFMHLWHELSIPAGSHVRRIHYRLVSQPTPILCPDRRPYENTDRCSHILFNAARDAVFLGLVPGAAIVDNKNDAPVEFLVEPNVAMLEVAGGLDYALYLPDELPPLPELRLIRPTIPQRYHVELWAEKSTMNDILLPLGQRHEVNIITGSGDLSATACRHAVNRAERSGRPTRILYISDFDPGGMSMPVGVSSKIHFEILKRDLGLNLQVRPVVLTHAQCVEFILPRTPTKEGDSRAAGFEERFGEGATELDALEAIHPGRLAQILTAEITRYRDPTLSARVAAVAASFDSHLHQINVDIAEANGPEMLALGEEYKELRRLIADFEEKAKDVYERTHEALAENATDLEDIEWPEPAIGDEDPDPLFDSGRPYVEQIDRFRRHQGKR